MTIHKTDRNIVVASTHRNAMELSFGPSDDDFHYQAHHASVAHDGSAMDKTKPMDIKLIFQGGACEIQYATGQNARQQYKWDGYLNISDGGKLTLPFNSEDGVPHYVEFDEHGLRVYAYEGCPPDDEREQWLIFDSNRTVSVYNGEKLMRISQLARASGLAQAIAKAPDNSSLSGIREGAAEIAALIGKPEDLVNKE